MRLPLIVFCANTLLLSAIYSLVFLIFYPRPYVEYQFYITFLSLGTYILIRPVLSEVIEKIANRFIEDNAKKIKQLCESISRLKSTAAILSEVRMQLPRIVHAEDIVIFQMVNSNLTLLDDTHSEAFQEFHNQADLLVAILSKKKAPLSKKDIVRLKRSPVDLKLKADAEVLIKLFERYGIQAAVPIRYKGTFSGFFLMLAHTPVLPFSKTETAMIQSLALYLGIAIKNAENFQQLNLHISQLRQLNRYAQALRLSLNSPQISQQIRNLIQALTGATFMIIYLPGDTDFRLEIYHNGNISEKLVSRNADWQHQTPAGGHPFASPFGQLPISEHIANLFKEHIGYVDTPAITYIPFIDNDTLFGAVWAQNVSSQDIPEEMYPSISLFTGSALNQSQLYQQVQREENRNASIIQHIPDGIIILTLDGQITQTNQAFSELFNHRKIASLSEFCTLDPELAPVMEKFNQKDYGRLDVYLPAQPISRHLQISLVPLHHNATILLVISDFTLVDSLEIKMEQAQRMTSLGTFAASIAHEIKNPLVSIHAFTQMLQSKWQDKVYQEKYQSIVHGQISRIESLSETLLDIGKPQNEAANWVTLNDVLTIVVMILEVEVFNKNILIKTEFKESPKIFINKSYLTQIILNLGLNAIQALSENGGTLVIASGHKPDYATVTIADNGPGIPDSVKANLFKPFVTTKEKGSGLGLSIVKRLLEESNSEIQIDSEKGKGTRVTLSFPINRKDTETETVKELTA